jgi:hypothetical protein
LAPLAPPEAPEQRRTEGIGARAREAGIEPRESLVRDVEPDEQSFLGALGYVLRIPTNLILILSSALGYYFFGGLRIFAIELLSGRYHLGHEAALGAAAAAGSGSIVGVYAGGRAADALLARGRMSARVWVAACAYLVSAVLFFLGLRADTLAFSLIFYFLAAFALGATNPPLDAARLDIVPPHLWGRAESVRMVVRKAAEAIAPVAFGVVAQHVFGSSASPLRATFLAMLIALFTGGLIGLLAPRTYLRDAASADALMERTRRRV